MILLRKQKLVRKSLIAQGGGEIKTDRIALPDNALCVTGLKAVGRHLQVSTPDVTVLHYFFGTSAEPTLSAENLMDLFVGDYKDLHPKFTVSAPTDSGLYIYFAHPTSLAIPYFTYQQFQGGFIGQGTLALAGPKGVETVRVYRSTNANLGENVDITANHE